MSLRAFLYAVEAVRLEEGVRFHVETAAAPEPTPADNRERNAQSMALLMGGLAGVKGAPGVMR
jgi:hypothetical protein